MYGYAYEDYDQGYQHESEQDQEGNTSRGEEHHEIIGSSSRVPYESENQRDVFGNRSGGEEAKLYRNIVKRYGPDDSREMSGTRSKGGSPNKQLPGQSKHSFHPETNQMPKDIYKDAGGKTDISRQDQWERLLKPKKESLEERDRLRREKEAMEIKNNCTFQPSINKNYQVTSAKYASEKNQNISDRLYAEGMEKVKNRNIERRKSDEGKDYTFKPNVAESVSYLKGEKLEKRPIHERLGEIMKQKQEFLQRIRINSEADNKDMVFKPTLNEYSEILATSKQQIKDVTDRLMRDAADKVHKKMRHNEELESKLTTLCTFQPSVQPMGRSNDEFLAMNDIYSNQVDVVTRQFIMADVQRENLQRKAAEVIAKEGCTFVPQVNKISQFLIEADPHRANENVYQKVDRLYKKDAQKKEIFQEQMQKAHYDQYTFKPEINKISRDIGKRTNLDDLAYNREAKEHLRILKEKSIDNMLGACSFKPDINRKKKYEDVEPLYKDEERIMDNVKLVNKKKEIKYEQMRKMEEYNEMRECTFKPRIKGEVSEEELKPKLGAAVAGVDKFMQMRERHKKQQEDKKKREQEVFGIDKKYSTAKHEGFTTPQPFNLSKGAKGSIRNMKVNQDLKEKAKKDLTFKPSTNAGRNRELINNYMSNGSRNGGWEN